MSKALVVVGIPALDEERTIAKVVLRARAHADRVLVIDDGSGDDTAVIAEAMGATVLRHERNLGKGAALRDCIQWARKIGANILVTIDGDAQHDASFIPTIIAALESNGADIVVGSRARRPSGMPIHRWLGGRTLDRITGVKVNGRYVDAQSGFRAYSRHAIGLLTAAEFGMGADSEVLMRADEAGLKIIEVPVAMNYSGPSTSSHNPIRHSLDVLFSLVKFISIRHPLTFYGGFSAIALAISLIFGIMTIDYYQESGRVITNLALVSVSAGILGFLALFTGIILFTMITVIRERQWN